MAVTLSATGRNNIYRVLQKFAKLSLDECALVIAYIKSLREN